ncbi:MAG: hypothetical protein ACI9IJ_002324, partial [Psychromonas sp.]
TNTASHLNFHLKVASKLNPLSMCAHSNDY